MASVSPRAVGTGYPRRLESLLTTGIRLDWSRNTSNDLRPTRADRRSSCSTSIAPMPSICNCRQSRRTGTSRGQISLGFTSCSSVLSVRRASTPTRWPKEQSRSAEWPEAHCRRCPANHSCGNTPFRSATGALPSVRCRMRLRRSAEARRRAIDQANGVEQRRHRRPVH
jgi:hypothetical protein